MLHTVSIKHYLEALTDVPLIDVRSPGEYEKGHIPGAINIPLFSNEERAAVGTVYKRQSRQAAIELGFQFVNPKREFLAHQSRAASNSHGIAIHCWRGGMRSRFFAEHLEQYGIGPVFLIEKGYKAFRQLALETFESEYRLHTIGGYTGSGKTEILQVLKKRGHQVLDLEQIANHKGSAFGGIGCLPQPTSEQFENDLFLEWRSFSPNSPIWIEDESRNIGSVFLPPALYASIREQKVHFLDIPRKERAHYLVNEYGHFPKEELALAIHKITRKLGGQHAQHALQLLEEGKYEEGVFIVLQYYDKLYEKGISRRDPSQVIRLPLQTVDAEKNASLILEHFENNFVNSSSHTI